jgi:hypothetical protein
MRCVDQQRDTLRFEMARQPLRAAEPADAHRHRLLHRCLRAPRQRQHDLAIAARRQPSGKLPRLAGAAQDQDMVHGHVR